jgi:hypothetical protein
MCPKAIKMNDIILAATFVTLPFALPGLVWGLVLFLNGVC